MICPVCKTNNTNHQDAEFCVQCGSDTHVHRLLHGVREGMLEGMNMKDEIKKVEKSCLKKTSILFIAFQVIPATLLLVCVVFGIFFGMRFLTFLDRAESRRVTVSNKWSEIGFEQLQQMNAIIKGELDLILDQRLENKALQEKIKELTTEQQPAPSADKEAHHAL